MPKLRRGNLRLQTKHLYPYIVCEHNWFDANNWHCQYLASQHLAKSKFAKCWQLFVRLRRKVGSQPITSQHLAFAKYWHANFWHQTNHALDFLYINLHLQTIPELLVTSGISSGAPNNFRVTVY